jgi:hypothetical protein
MTARACLFARAVLVVASLAVCPSTARAQGVEITPLAGYRFGNHFYELVTARPVDLDGAVAFGVVVDVPLSDGLQFESFITHQQADVFAAAAPTGRPVGLRVAVDHFQAGGLQELDGGRLRPFLTGMIGLTRYAAEADNEIRFSVSVGGGVKVLPTPRVGLRLESRVFATFVDANGTAVACGPGGCLLALRLNVAWQIEFTAGVVVRLP